jgi:nucleoside-diphosphate kinase
MTGGAEEQPLMKDPHIYVERTLAIIKPDAIHKCEEIEDIILRSGFAILQVCTVHCNFNDWMSTSNQSFTHP